MDTLPPMHSRALRVGLLVFEALWLNVIVPGHQRGIVRLPGQSCAACRAQIAERCRDPSGRTGTPAKDKSHGDPAQHCAICYFAARLCTPPVVDLTPPPLRLVALLPFPAPTARQSAQLIPTYYGRGPPPGQTNLV